VECDKTATSNIEVVCMRKFLVLCFLLQPSSPSAFQKSRKMINYRNFTYNIVIIYDGTIDIRDYVTSNIYDATGCTRTQT
jgi:hypothetical protein